MAVKILEHIKAAMKNHGMTNADLAEKMNSYDDGAGNWTKERIDKIFGNDDSCPRADTLAEMKRAVGIPDFEPWYYRSKGNGHSND